MAWEAGRWCGTEAGAERLRRGAGEEEGRPGELCVEVVREPVLGFLLLTLGAVAVAPGMRDTVVPPTGMALIQAVTIRPALARWDGADDRAVCEGQLGGALHVCWAKGSEELAAGGHDRSLPSGVDALSGGEGR